MRITNEQQEKLDSLRCLRAKDVPTDILNEIKGPRVNGQDATLVDLFRNPNYLQEDIDGALASYVIVSPQNQVLVFFSIRCGELFFKSDPHKMVLGHNAWVAVNMLMNKGLTEDDRKKALGAIRAALDEGIAFDDFEFYADKKQSFINDVKKEPSTEASRVSQVFPAVELKFFGVNANASDYWKALKLNQKMGETLFWNKIIPMVDELRNHVGCRFLYLFAADNEAEGHLVTYYKERLLHVEKNQVDLSFNKPYFDYESRFLYQDISKLIKEKERFFNTFNTEVEDPV